MPIEMLYEIKVKCKFKTNITVQSNGKIIAPVYKFNKFKKNPFLFFTSYIFHAEDLRGRSET